jgi:hypothetical protein
MDKLCIVMLHHKNDTITQSNLKKVTAENPGVQIVPIWCDDTRSQSHVDGAVEVKRTFDRGYNWHNADIIWNQWYRSEKRIEAERYMFLEYDCRCFTAVEQVYKTVWDDDAVAAHVHRPVSTPNWRGFWQTAYLPWSWSAMATGISPLNGVMLSRKAMDAWASLDLPPGIHCELRIGTALRVAGFDWKPLPERIARHNLSRRHNFTPMGGTVPATGMWHPIKAAHE